MSHPKNSNGRHHQWRMAYLESVYIDQLWYDISLDEQHQCNHSPTKVYFGPKPITFRLTCRSVSLTSDPSWTGLHCPCCFTPVSETKSVLGRHAPSWSNFWWLVELFKQFNCCHAGMFEPKMMTFFGTFCLNAKMSSHLNVGFKHLSVTSHLSIILTSPDIFQFYSEFGKNGQIIGWRPTFGFGATPPPLGNPRSTSDTNSSPSLRQTHTTGVPEHIGPKDFSLQPSDQTSQALNIWFAPVPFHYLSETFLH